MVDSYIIIMSTKKYVMKEWGEVDFLINRVLNNKEICVFCSILNQLSVTKVGKWKCFFFDFRKHKQV